MKYYFSSIKWIKGSAGLEQGFRGNYVPSNAIAGGNGSYICSYPAKLLLRLKSEDGNICEFNIVKTVRAVNGWRNLSNNRFGIIEARLEDEYEFEVVNGEILNLSSIVNVS